MQHILFIAIKLRCDQKEMKFMRVRFDVVIDLKM